MRLGLIETRGLTAAISAADAACKAASVIIIGYQKVGAGLVTICLQGEVSAVKAAVENGVAVVPPGLFVSSLVIARPDNAVIDSLKGVAYKRDSQVASSLRVANSSPISKKRVNPDVVAKSKIAPTSATKTLASNLLAPKKTEIKTSKVAAPKAKQVNSMAKAEKEMSVKKVTTLAGKEVVADAKQGTEKTSVPLLTKEKKHEAVATSNKNSKV